MSTDTGKTDDYFVKCGYSSSPSNLPHHYGNSHTIQEDTQCYLPPDKSDISALTPTEAGTRLSDPGGMQG